MRLNGIEIPEKLIEEFCRRHGVVRLSVFGSILRSDFNAGSDVDVLVEFSAGSSIGLFGFGGMQVELGHMLGRIVHLHTPAMLPPRVRDRLRQEARVQYAA